MRILRFFGYTVLVIVALVLAAYLAIYLWSLTMPAIPPVRLSSSPNPAQSYDEAMTRFDALLAGEIERGDIDEVCLPFILTHGARTERAIILFHGLTACPFQYHELAQLFYDEGYNVYVPRLPRHGYSDRTSNALAELTAEELAAMMDPTADLAAGLGEEVTMAGLSLGGNVAAQGGQLRADLRLAAPMSPALGFRFVPDFLTPALTRLILGLSPDIYIWWDPINKAEFQAESGYPGFSLRSLGEIYRMGLAIRALADSQPPASQSQLMISNWGDPAVSLGAIDALATAWRRNGGDTATYRFPLLPWLPHDFISTDAVGARTDLTYPKLIELITTYP
ncbi:MAG: alpha/beta fold hydrolase [Caldilinea sp.]